LNVHGVNDVRLTEMPTARPLVPAASSFEVDIAIEKESYKLTDIDQIPAEMISRRQCIMF
jgi:hypothetical protein